VWGEFRRTRANTDRGQPRRPARSEQNPAKKFWDHLVNSVDDFHCKSQISLSEERRLREAVAIAAYARSLSLAASSVRLIQWHSWLLANEASDIGDMFESLVRVPETPELVCEYTAGRLSGE